MYEIAVIPGDGIGPEVVREGLKVLEAVSGLAGFTYQTHEYPYGADHYLATGETLPVETLESFRKMHAIFLGALGDPRVAPGVLERGIVGGIRFKLDLFVNLRPVVLYAEHLCPLKDKRPADVDMIVVRENTEDAYVGIQGFFKQDTPDEVAVQQILYTRKGVERIVRYAFELARTRPRKKLTLVDKVNALQSHDLWRRVFSEVGREYPDVTTENAFVDATCMWMVKNPEWFDVVVTTNMFGDIITDLGAMIQGGMGLAASGNIHPGQVSMFEPIHGSAPKHAGKNNANPLGAILALSMMLEFLGEKKAGQLVESSVRRLLADGVITDVSAQSSTGTDRVGDLVVEELERQARVTV